MHFLCVVPSTSHIRIRNVFSHTHTLTYTCIETLIHVFQTFSVHSEISRKCPEQTGKDKLPKNDSSFDILPSERNNLHFADIFVCALLNKCGQMWPRKPQNVL